jgi:hypothetical protein
MSKFWKFIWFIVKSGIAFYIIYIVVGGVCAWIEQDMAKQNLIFRPSRYYTSYWYALFYIPFLCLWGIFCLLKIIDFFMVKKEDATTKKKTTTIKETTDKKKTVQKKEDNTPSF